MYVVVDIHPPTQTIYTVATPCLVVLVLFVTNSNHDNFEPVMNMQFIKSTNNGGIFLPVFNSACWVTPIGKLCIKCIVLMSVYHTCADRG